MLIGGIAIALNMFVFINVDWIIKVLQVPEEIQGLMREYLVYVFMGIMATFLYNYFANLLRAVGNSIIVSWGFCCLYCMDFTVLLKSREYH